ncbi:MAG: DUF748 domain-containing protein [Planctomycetes bacterium]|nr:DUF748 domain-containing protein [Planctomycetota bacterium]
MRSLAWVGERVAFVDRSREEPVEFALEALDARLVGLVLGGEGERAPARLELSASAGELARELSLRGALATRPNALDVHGELELSAGGLDLRRLAPYLAPLQIEPVVADGALHVGVRADVVERDGRTTFGLALADVALREGDEELAALGALELEDASATPAELRIGALRVRAPRLAVTLEETGALRTLGLRVLPRVPVEGGLARLPRLHELIDLSALEELARSIALGEGPALRLDALALEDAQITWNDLVAAPAVHAPLGVDARLDGLVLGREAPPARFDATLRVADALERLHARGELLAAPRHAHLTADVAGAGLRAGALASYVPPGVEVTLVDGRLTAVLDAELEEREPGVYAARAALSQVDYREAGAERALFALGELGGSLDRYAPEEGVLELGELFVRGVELDLERDGGQVLRALGARVDLQALAAAAPPSSEPSAAPAERFVDRSGSAKELEERKPFPRVSLRGLDVGVARLGIADAAVRGGRPLDLALALRTDAPQVLLDAQPEELAPLKLHVGGAVPPAVGEIAVDVVAEPYAAEPRLHVDARVGGIDAQGVLELLPELAEQIDGAGLREGELTASLDVVLRARRRGPTDFDLRSGFGLELEMGELALRDRPGGEVLGGLGGVRAEVRRFEPRTGDLHVTELELVEPKGHATRVAEGLRVAGVVLKVPTGEAQAAAPDDEPEAASAETELVPQVALPDDLPDLRIDRFYVTGMDVTLRDEVVTPRMVLPLRDLDVEVRGLSTSALRQGRPVRFNAFAGAGAVLLPERDAYGRLVRLQEGEESEWPLGRYAVERRPAFDELTVNGEVKLAPTLAGRLELALRGLELLNYSGLSREAGVEIQDGVLDQTVSMRLRERGLSVDSTSTFTGLSMSEGEGGPLSSALSLPAPLDTVLFMTRNASGENVLPASLYVPASGLSLSSLAATAVSTLTQVLASSIAQSPFRVVGGLLDLTGVTSDEPEPRTLDSTDLAFEPGAAREAAADGADLTALREKLRAEPDLVLVVQHELGGGDVARCAALANPDPRWCAELAAGLRLDKQRLWALRERAAEEVRVEYAMGELDRAESLAQHLRELDAQLGRTEDALDEIYQLLRPGAERRADKRTKAACLELARLRLALARARLLAELGPEVAERLDVRRPRFAPAEGDGGGRVVVTPKRR